MSTWTDMRYAVVDVEGNGQQPPDLVELAIVPVVSGVIGEPSSWLVRPLRRISHIATRIHGISNDDVAQAPNFEQIADHVRQQLAVDAVVAHNAHVDVGVLQRHLGDWECPPVIDTLKLAKQVLPAQVSYRLGTLAETLALTAHLPPGLKPHRATYDALVCARLLLQLANNYGVAGLLSKPPFAHAESSHDRLF
jgi:DNA polymerase III epsilon subunit-like protein